MLTDMFVGAIWLIVVIGAVSQVFIPLARGKALFPSFSSQERKLNELRNQLEKLQSRNQELELQRQIDEEQNRQLALRLAALKQATGDLHHADDGN